MVENKKINYLGIFHIVDSSHIDIAKHYLTLIQFLLFHCIELLSTIDQKPMSKATSDFEVAAAFCYNHLDHSLSQIRLLTLLPCAEEIGTLRARLDAVSLALQAPAYEALSYTWGDQTKTYPLLIDDKELRVSQNLFDALPAKVF